MEKSEILFRGMRTDTKEWVQGNLINWHPNKAPRIIWFELDPSKFSDGFKETNFEVIQETVGQLHNGLTAKAGKNVFAGDIILHDLAEGFGEPVKQNCKTIVTSVEMFTYFFTDVKVVGNIHETPEKP